MRYHIRVLIPCYKEPLDVISKTVMAALFAQLPANCKRTVYLCDDGKDIEKKQFIRSLQMSNALLGETETSLSELQLTMTKDEIEAQALGLTPVSKVAMLGGTVTVSPKWQVSADYRLSSVSGTIATANLPASPDTGQVKTVSAHAIGTGLFSPSSVLVFNTSYLTSEAYDAWLFGVNSRFRVGQNWIIEPGIKYYRQDNAVGSFSKRLTPVGRFTYQLRQNIAFEAEVNLEKTRTEALNTTGDAVSLFYYVGYRYDF